MKTEYQVTIGYKAVVCVSVISESEERAREQALAIFKADHEKWFKKRGVDLQDDNFSVAGVVNMDETWNILYK
jgi:hypothetical protein